MDPVEKASIEKVAVIGAGIMGAGIANAIFKRGYRVCLHDIDADLLTGACESIKKKARRTMDPDKITTADSLDAAVHDADLVIEAVVEDLDLKRELFSKLDAIAADHTVLASNTSSLAISSLADATSRSDRVIGTHFFNPAVIMRLVEIITPRATSGETRRRVTAFIASIGKVGVEVVESPGFVVNRILVPMINEAFQLLDEHSLENGSTQIATANDIDAAVEREEILLMGPFNLADMIGLDTILKVSKVIHEGFGGSPRYRPAPALTAYVDKGHFGRKTGRGVYRYTNTIIDPDENPMIDDEERRIERVKDPRFDTLELLASVVNEACRVVEEGIVKSLSDVETCIDLGARWFKGPFQLAREIGLETVVTALEARARATGETERYEPSRLLTAPGEELKAFLEAHEE